MPLETNVWRGSPVACVDRGAAAAEAGADGAPLPRSGRHARPRVASGGADETRVRTSPSSWALLHVQYHE